MLTTEPVAANREQVSKKEKDDTSEKEEKEDTSEREKEDTSDQEIVVRDNKTKFIAW